MNLKRSILTTVLLGTIAVLLSTIPVSAGTVYFNVSSIDGNTPLDGSKFGLEITDVGGQVQFKFSNNQPTESYIYQIYWDDDASLLSFSNPTLQQGFEVSFNGPGHLPGDTNIGFSEDFVVGAVKTGRGRNQTKKKENAIGAGEMGLFLFDLNGVATAGDVETALMDGTLRVGIHVQGIYFHTADGGGMEGSDSFYTGPPVGLPEPSTLILLLSGMGILGGAARFRRKA